MLQLQRTNLPRGRFSSAFQSPHGTNYSSLSLSLDLLSARERYHEEMPRTLCWHAISWSSPFVIKNAGFVELVHNLAYICLSSWSWKHSGPSSAPLPRLHHRQDGPRRIRWGAEDPENKLRQQLPPAAAVQGDLRRRVFHPGLRRRQRRRRPVRMGVLPGHSQASNRRRRGWRRRRDLAAAQSSAVVPAQSREDGEEEAGLLASPPRRRPAEALLPEEETLAAVIVVAGGIHCFRSLYRCPMANAGADAIKPCLPPFVSISFSSSSSLLAPPTVITIIDGPVPREAAIGVE